MYKITKNINTDTMVEMDTESVSNLKKKKI